MDHVQREVKEGSIVNSKIHNKTNIAYSTPLNYNIPHKVRNHFDFYLEEKNKELVNNFEDINQHCKEQLSHASAHLFTDICECGKTKNDTHLTRESLVSSLTNNQAVLDTHSTENRLDKFFTILMLMVTTCNILSCFGSESLTLKQMLFFE